MMTYSGQVFDYSVLPSFINLNADRNPIIKVFSSINGDAGTYKMILYGNATNSYYSA